MASSSSATESQVQDLQQQAQQQEQPERAAYVITGSTMKLQEHQLKIQVENPVDFKSLMFHGCDIKDYYVIQGLMKYFDILNGPTYKTLVRHFWVRAPVHDKEASEEEERNLVLFYPELEGKSREEMGLEPFKGAEIRSSVMGVPVVISEEIIAYVIGVEASGQYSGIEIPNPKNSTWNDVVNETLFKSTKAGKYADLDMEKKMLLKIQYENLLPKGGHSDQPSLAHKVFIPHIINGEKVKMLKCIFKHMIKELRESQRKDRAWVPYGRLISEIFHQGGIIQALNETRFYTDDKLETVVGKVINGKTLKNMQLVKKFTPLNTDINESMVVSDLMANFPPICKKDSLAVQMALLTDHFANTGEIIGLEEVPQEMYGGKLPVENGRKAKRKEMTQEEYLEAEKPSKRVKKDKASEKLKTADSDVPTIQEEVQDLDPEAIVEKKTRSGISAAPASTKAPKQTLLKKSKKTPTIRKLEESVYVTEEIEGVEAATELVIREVKKKKAEEAAALQKALEVAKEIEVPASLLSKTAVAAVSEEAMKNVAELQGMVTSEVENLLMASVTEEEVQDDLAATSEAATISGNSDSERTNSVINIESESNSSQSNSSSSSSTNIDDIPLDILYKSKHKG